MYLTLKLRVLIAVLILALLPLVVSAQAPGPDETTLIVAQSTDVTSLDPPQVGARPESNVVAHLFGNLYDIDVAGNITPSLAEDVRVSEDGTEYTFTLREGLTCHNGEPLTAEDVVYTFQRAADPELAFTGNTPGFVFSSMGYVDARVDGELEPTIIIDARNSIALGLITEVRIYCMDTYEAMTLEEAANNPVGSGPYRFVEWVRDDYLLMEKWDDYALFDPDTFEQIVWRVIPEASTRVAELIAGNVDIITNVLPDQHDAVNNSGVAEIQAVQGFRRIFIGFNFTDNVEGLPGAEEVQDPAVRVALQYAVDVPTICAARLGVECERANGMVNAPNNHPELEPYPYDPEQAEALLDEAGYPRDENGVRFEMILQGGRNRYLNDEAVILTICQYLDDIGVQTDCQIQDFNTEFIPALVSQQAGPMYFVGSGGGNWNPLYEMADLAGTDSNPNYGRWFNEEWFSSWDRLAEVGNPEEEREIVLNMLEIFYNDPPWLMLYFQPDFYGVSTRLAWEGRRDEKLYVQDATLR
ncbi:MAG: ABC transporter substrate-binding protein [Chloroflexi bacterium]|nr:ABC transporter substrate-binding protein [Chloroflexota bacterium]